MRGAWELSPTTSNSPHCSVCRAYPAPTVWLIAAAMIQIATDRPGSQFGHLTTLMGTAAAVQSADYTDPIDLPGWRLANWRLMDASPTLWRIEASVAYRIKRWWTKRSLKNWNPQFESFQSISKHSKLVRIWRPPRSFSSSDHRFETFPKLICECWWAITQCPMITLYLKILKVH